MFISILERENALEIKEIRTRGELEKAKRSGLTLVDFNAPWCAPCLLQEPIIRQLADHFKEKASILSVNIDESRDVALNTGVRSIPTLILFSNGKEVQRFVGLQSAATLLEAMEKFLT